MSKVALHRNGTMSFDFECGWGVATAADVAALREAFAPGWTRITDDPETWPPDDDTLCAFRDPSIDGRDVDGAFLDAARKQRLCCARGWRIGALWLPLPEPPEGGSNDPE